MRAFGELNFYILIITCFTLFADEHVTGTLQSDQQVRSQVVQKTIPNDRNTKSKKTQSPGIKKISVVQKLDHFNDYDVNTWNQRAYFDSQYENDDGVALLKVGDFEEIYPSRWKEPWLAQLAEKLNAPLYVLQHRYHGESFPTDLSAENLKYIRIEQALADIEFFIKKTKHATRKWVVCGTGYGGTLAVLFRVKYPDVASGVLALYPMLHADTEDNDTFNIAALLDNDKLLKALQDAFEAIREAVKSKKYEELKEKFNMCTRLDEGNNKEDNEDFMYWSMLHYVLYNITVYLERMMDWLSDESKENILDRFSPVIKNTNKGKCFSVNYVDAINEYKKLQNVNEEDYPFSLKMGLGTRPSFYKSCTEYGTFATSKGEPEKLGVKINLDFYLKMCEHTFDKTFNSDIYGKMIDTTNMFYGGEHIAVTNLIYLTPKDITWNNIVYLAESEFNEIIKININDSIEYELGSACDLIISKVNDWTKKKSVVGDNSVEGATKEREETVVSDDDDDDAEEETDSGT